MLESSPDVTVACMAISISIAKLAGAEAAGARHSIEVKADPCSRPRPERHSPARQPGACGNHVQAADCTGGQHHVPPRPGPALERISLYLL